MLGIGEWIALATAGLGALGMVCGGVWWLATIASGVSTIKDDCKHIRGRVNRHSDQLQESRDHATACDADRTTTNAKLEDHEGRLRVVEGLE